MNHLLHVLAQFDRTRIDAVARNWRVSRRQVRLPLAHLIWSWAWPQLRGKQDASFVKSLRASGYQGDVLLLVGHMDAELEAFFREYRVDTDLFSEAHFLPMDRQLARFFTTIES